MIDSGKDIQNQPNADEEPTKAVKDSAPVPVFSDVSDDNLQKLGLKDAVDGAKQAYEDNKKKQEEYRKQCEMIYINGKTDLVYWKSEFTDKSGISLKDDLIGMPYNRHTTKKEGFKTENITIKHFSEQKYPDGLRPHIHKVKNPDGSSAFLFEGKKYAQEDLVQYFKPDSVKNRDFFRYALQCLRVEEQTVYEPYITEKDGHFYFPEDVNNIYADPNNPLQSIYMNNLKIGKIDGDFVNEGRKLLKKYPKQAAIYLIVPAQMVVNLLGIEDFLYSLEIISERDTGKSFAVRMALHHFEGITGINKSDIINAAWRNAKFLSGTNLSFYVEEAELSSKIKRSMKSSGMTARGKPNLTVEIYKQSASLILSANSSEVDDNQDEQKAIDKRFLQIFLNKQDVVPEEERTIGKKYVKRMERENGGLLFTEILNKHTISELENKYYELDTKYQNRLELLLHYGEFLADITYEELTGIKQGTPIDFGTKEEENWLIVFYHWAKGLPENKWYKQRDLKNDLKVDNYVGTEITKEITFSDELYQIFVSEHRNMPFSRLKDFRKKYNDFVKVDMFSINNQKARFTKIVCDNKFYKSIGIGSESDKESQEKSKGLFED